MYIIGIYTGGYMWGILMGYIMQGRCRRIFLETLYTREREKERDWFESKGIQGGYIVNQMKDRSC